MFELYSVRTKKTQCEPEVCIYEIPVEFRNQAFYCICDVFNKSNAWEELHNAFAREKGYKELSKYGDEKSKIENYMSVSRNEDFLDFIDFTFNFINKISYTDELKLYFDEKKAKHAIDELNYRFKQHNIGYEFVEGQIIRVDNELLHQEIVKPALKLLFENEFKGAEQEFLKAFEERRKGENKNAISNALKSFESTIKTICSKKGFEYDAEKDTAKNLIKILEDNSFYPSYMSCHMTSLRTTLESGLPTLRNKKAGHGQGETVVNVSDEFAEYALNLAATNIVLLVKIYASSKMK